MNWKWWDWLILVFLIIGLTVYGWRWWNSRENNGAKVEYIAADREGETKVTIWVDISGAVMKPGVYELDSQARVKDVLVAAGGLSVKADRDYVSKNINLAKKVNDGEKIFVPAAGEGNGVVAGVATSSTGDKVNVNLATKEQLMKLSGVGEVRAQAIIDNRPYTSAEELVSKKVISESVLEKNKELIVIY